MQPRIAIPVPHSGDPEYAEHSLPQYENAVKLAGGEPVRIPLDQTPAQVMKLIESCDGVLLPGSKADVDPSKFKASRHAKTADADTHRDNVDELLLQDAYKKRKPVLGICYGLQILNVHRGGTLLQHIESPVNHEAGRKVPIAHTAEIDPQSKLGEIVAAADASRSGIRASDSDAGGSPVSRLTMDDSVAAKSAVGISVEGHSFNRAAQPARSSGALAPEKRVIPVNSSHHQSAEAIGDGLRIVARCPGDGIIEAVEGTSPDHFVIAVQWHPERSVENDEPSRAIFRALIDAARTRHKKLAREFESV